MSGLDVHVGDGFDRLAERVADAWHRAERGETVDENHLTFMSWEGLARVMTGERFELLRRLHRSPAASVVALSASLGRDPGPVREDVEALLEAGLIAEDEVGLRADYDEIRAVITL